MKDLNKYVLLVMKWLNDKDSVTQQELIDNRADADAYAAYAAAYAAANAAYAAAAYAADDAEKWVGKYFERSGDNKQDYIDALKGDVKTTMDAVNEHKGVWPFPFDNHMTQLTDNGAYEVAIDDFNQLVSECETNFGASVSYAEYKKGVEFTIGKDYEFSDDEIIWESGVLNNYSGDEYQSKSGNKTEWYPYMREAKPQAKPVYTKEMARFGALPSVGMEYQGGVIVVAADADGMYVVQEVGVSIICALSGITPVAPPIQLEDGKAYQFECKDRICLGFFGVHSGIGRFTSGDIKCHWRVDDCTNIKRLTVKESGCDY